MEQDLTRDPVTGFHRSDPRHKDAHQNDNYVRHTDPAETTRDYSRPHTIPADEFEAATGQRHGEALAEYEKNERDREAQAERQARGA
jgi:hypothetical protein